MFSEGTMLQVVLKRTFKMCLWIVILIQILSFRSRILVEGKLDYGEYVDKNQVRRQATTIIAGRRTNTRLLFMCDRLSDLGNSSRVWFGFSSSPLCRQHRLPERQRPRQNLNHFPLRLHPTTTRRRLLFVFSCLYKKKIRLRTWTPPSKGTDTCKRSPGRQNIPRCGSRSICGALILVYSRLKITTQVSRVRIMLERRKIPWKTFHCVWRQS